MYARLWWKDVRQFWPIMAVLAASSAGCQWLLLRYGGPGVRDGLLPVAALGWVLLYGFAVSAAAFAGERENDTLLFLDMIPVGRKVLWGAKASFAVASTLALAVALVATAWIASDHLLPWDPRLAYGTGPDGVALPHAIPGVGVGLAALAVAAILLEVIGWGLFWSAASSNAMVAAVLAMSCSAFGLTLIRQKWVSDPEDLLTSTPWRLGLALATSAASCALLALGERPRRPLSDVFNVEITVRRRNRRDRPRWRVLPPQVKAMAWQTLRGAWPVFWRLAAIGCGTPMIFTLAGVRVEPGLVASLNVLLLLVAGVNVFGAENRGRAHRFLAHHGAGAGVVWWTKVSVWAALIVPYAVVVSATLAAADLRANPGRVQGFGWVPSFAVVALTVYAVGVLCGMTIRRGITAGLVAVLGVFAVGVPQVTMLTLQILPWAVPPLVPVALLAVSRAWTGDWMLDRPDLGRWGRLAALLSAALLFVFAVTVGVRVWGVPDVGPGFDVPAFVRAAAVDPRDNAADLYREAIRRLGVRQTRVRISVERQETAEALDLVRRASTLPACRFVRLDRVTRVYELRDLDSVNVLRLTQMVRGSFDEHRGRGDLAGAWDDLMVLFRMARQLSGPVPVGDTLATLNDESKALGLAMQWAADPRQTSPQIRAALDAYQGLRPMPPVVDSIRAESVLVRNTLNLPSDELRGLAAGSEPRGHNGFEEVLAAVKVSAETSPWEIARARRVFQLLFAGNARRASAEPGARNASPYFHAWQGSTPLSRLFFPPDDTVIEANDRNEVARRALVQILALRHWQLTHGGKFPDALDALVSSGELKSLPGDPYANGSLFRYVRSTGQSLLPLGQLAPFPGPLTQWHEGQPTTGRWLLYSVGSDRKDDGASRDEDSRTRTGDLIFPLPNEDGGGD